MEEETRVQKKVSEGGETMGKRKWRSGEYAIDSAEIQTMGCGKGYGEEQVRRRRHQQETDDVND